jgi:hypothetical protein
VAAWQQGARAALVLAADVRALTEPTVAALVEFGATGYW